MARARAEKADLDNRTFLDGAIYLYRRKNSKHGKWDIRLKVHGHKGYIIRSSGTANEHERGSILPLVKFAVSKGYPAPGGRTHGLLAALRPNAKGGPLPDRPSGLLL